jgi:hypothetical protein
MERSLGARLRAHRERKQISLEAIAAETKIKPFMLEGLEHDDVSSWPEGIYRRAYVRSYAHAVGLDPQALVREFLEAHPDPVVLPPPEEQTELETPHWPAEFRRLVTSALAVVPARRPAVDRPGVERVDSVPAPPEAVKRVRATQPQPEPAVPDLARAAELCTRLARAADAGEVSRVLADAVQALDAVGMVVWGWDAAAGGLAPVFWSGYADDLVARMPVVRASAENGIATAFRTADVCVVPGAGGASGAVIAPILARGRCAGVLAAEIRNGREHRAAVRATTTILAAQLVSLFASVELPQAVNA